MEGLKIERLDESWRRGYRINGQGNDTTDYVFLEVFWKKISGHYLIQQKYRKKVNWRFATQPKPEYTEELEILNPEVHEDEARRRRRSLS